MTKPEWGLKRKCLKCGAFFYDMRKAKFVCPKCGATYAADSYADAKTKQLLKLAKKAAPKIDDEIWPLTMIFWKMPMILRTLIRI